MTLQEIDKMVNASKASEAFGPARLAEHKRRPLASPAIELCELSSAYMLQLSFFDDQKRALTMALKKQFGLSLPGFSTSVFGKDITVMRVEFPKIWLVSSKKFPALPNAFDKFYPLEITGSRSLIQISGEASDELIRRLTSADLRQDVGHVFATAMHHIPVHLQKTAPHAYVLFTPRSYAESLSGMIAEIGYQFGCNIVSPKRYQAPKG